MDFSGKRYNFFGDYLFSRFGTHVLKLPVNAGLSCPNRDGSIDSRGCIFCSDDGSSAQSARDEGSVHEQMLRAKNSFKRGNYEIKYIAYFQSFTNTYASVEQLRQLYQEAVSFDDSIIGLMIGTRPDCITDEIAAMIAEFNRPGFELWIELGIQSMHEASLQFLNRHHSTEDSVNALALLRKHRIKCCAHLILGIPGESWSDMMKSAVLMNDLGVSGVKFHQLHVIKGTELERMYYERELKMICFDDYISTLCDMLERLSPEILIHRLSADRERESLIAPNWGLHKGSIQKGIEDELKRRGSWQGFLVERGI